MNIVIKNGKLTELDKKKNIVDGVVHALLVPADKIKILNMQDFSVSPDIIELLKNWSALWYGEKLIPDRIETQEYPFDDKRIKIISLWYVDKNGADKYKKFLDAGNNKDDNNNKGAN